MLNSFSEVKHYLESIFSSCVAIVHKTQVSSMWVGLYFSVFMCVFSEKLRFAVPNDINKNLVNEIW